MQGKSRQTKISNLLLCENLEKIPDKWFTWIKRTVGEQWKRDQRRLACFYRLGYTVVIVWQTDWDRDKETAIERIQHALRIS